MLDQIITQLRQLKLTGMANALISQIEQPGTYEALPFEQRLQLLADAILDRLLHNAHRIKRKGDSMRKIQSKID